MKRILTVLAIVTLCIVSIANEVKSVVVPTVAILPFEARDQYAQRDNAGKSVAELIGISLMESSNISLVERAELDKALAELQLSAAGLVEKSSQLKLGQLVGAKILVTGSLFKVGEKNYLVAKVISVETSRVLGASVSSNNAYIEMSGELAIKIANIITQNSSDLLPKLVDNGDVFQELKSSIKGNNRKVYLSIVQDENSSVYESELKKLLLELNFEIVKTPKDASFIIKGNATATNAGAYKQFSSATSRVELSIYNRDDKLLISASKKATVASASYVSAAQESTIQATLNLATQTFTVLK